jgi:hypothetical protein
VGDDSDLVRVVVAVDPDRYATVVDTLRAAGVVVDDEWPTTGTLAGRLPTTLLADIRACDGVVAVEAERTFRTAPPGSEVQ